MKRLALESACLTVKGHRDCLVYFIHRSASWLIEDDSQVPDIKEMSKKMTAVKRPSGLCSGQGRRHKRKAVLKSSERNIHIR